MRAFIKCDGSGVFLGVPSTFPIKSSFSMPLTRLSSFPFEVRASQLNVCLAPELQRPPKPSGERARQCCSIPLS